MAQKKYEELELADDFMFGKVMENKELCRRVLETLLGVSIEEVEYPERQKSINISAEGKSVRLDVYVQDNQDILYDAEMQRESGDKKINEELSQRSRYYQGMIDLNLLEKGFDYRELKECYVIFICTFDPFGKGLYRYTFRNVCQERTEFMLNDRTVKVFFNTKGQGEGMPQAVRNLFDYVNVQKVTDDLTRKLDLEVQKIRQNKMWRREYMKSLLYEMDIRREAEYEGREAGMKEGTGRVNLLIQKLSVQGRMDDIVRAASDPKFQDELFEEFEIK